VARFRLPHLIFLLGLTVPTLSPDRLGELSRTAAEEARNPSPYYLSLPIWGYFHPAWMPGGMNRFGTAALSRLSRDPKGLMEGTFQIPDELRTRVLFWSAVYSRFDSKMKIVHDRHDPNLIYGYIDFSPLFEKHSRMGAIIESERIERNILIRLQGAILGVASLAASPLSGPYEARFRDFLNARGFDQRNTIETLARGVRTQTGQSDIFQEAIARSRGSLPEMEKVFTDHGLPRSLARIPFVESSFNPKARSKVGAMGLWQFIPLTAREMIHRHDKKKWRDPSQQTRAAARLLRRYRKALPDWASTVTSYNSGIGRVSKLLDRHGSGVGVILAADDNELGFAGRNFYSEFLAATLVEAYWPQLFPLDDSATPSLAENAPGS
jgi:membrane-bound lytic murein transglycosylase D